MTSSIIGCGWCCWCTDDAREQSGDAGYRIDVYSGDEGLDDAILDQLA